MKDFYQVWHQKEADLVRVRKEIESLRIVAPLLLDPVAEESTEKISAQSFKAEATAAATGTDGVSTLFQEANSRRSFWDSLRRKG